MALARDLNPAVNTLGVGTVAVTAKVHVAASNGEASTAPIKLTAGTNLVTPEDGAIEFDGTSLYVTAGGVRTALGAGGGGGGVTDHGALTGLADNDHPQYLTTYGEATIDFSTGSNEASIVVTGQTAITLTSKVYAFIMADDTTADHTANDHKYAPELFSVSCGALVAGTGFTIYARSIHKISGTFKVRFAWGN